MNTAQNTPKATRQCWECLKRRLVCDCTLPRCNKCVKRGRECPGYDAKKPLQWVEPGKVTSRKRIKPSKDTRLVLQVRPRRSPMGNPPRGSGSSSETVGSEEEDRDAQKELRYIYQKAMADAHTVEDVEKVFHIESQDRIAEIVSKGLYHEAAKVLKMEKDPLKGLRRVLLFMKLEQLPVYNLRNDTSEVVQAINYFNTRIIPEVTESRSALVRNPHIMFFPASSLHLLTPSTHSIYVCLALQHYINRLPPGASEKALVANGPKLWQYRGEAIQELSRRIADPKTMYSLATITSIVVFVTNELQCQPLPQWRSHIDVLMRIMEVRGGLMQMYRSAFYTHPTVVLVYLMIVVSNTTSPCHNQVVLAPTLKQELADVEELYHELFPYCLSPPAVFFFVIRISNLRREASQALILNDDITSHSQLAANLLSQIQAFSVDDWAQPGAENEDWLAIGSAYKHAAAVYCIMSLQSLALLPDDARTSLQLENHGDLLVSSLKNVIASSRTQRFAGWPLSMAGVEAGYRGEARHKWIENSCSELSRLLGNKAPSNLKLVLRKYWNSGNLGWEECFDKPYVFMF
ncbi:hypothetical protein P171DRAFT_396381 [Karstenula rhodostoma CBS 690.94]|uniref:Zn(2)-C6 fungal-type domain-containing protein n=1 Tax=Karstenula rhodostoma CBS 690.94 TaxID=1392251 RepID=A0A9P4PBW2_9PLEO|nr:hypothetical protein P171DRAFT_396381 [Karstenula rhodostoma CBS 690.94]